MTPVSSIAMQLNALTRIAAASGDLHLPTLSVITAPSDVDRTTLFADLTFATFTGSTPVAGLVWGSPYIDIDGIARMDCPSVDFVVTGGPVDETIVGAVLTDAGVANLYLSWIFDRPVPLTAVNQGFTVYITYPYGA